MASHIAFGGRSEARKTTAISRQDCNGKCQVNRGQWPRGDDLSLLQEFALGEVPGVLEPGPGESVASDRQPRVAQTPKPNRDLPHIRIEDVLAEVDRRPTWSSVSDRSCKPG